MTRPTVPAALNSVMKLVAEHGTDAIAAAFGRLLGIAMEAQRDAAIGAFHHERSEDRRGHRNGYEPTTLTTRVCESEIQVPKTRGIPFHPDCLGQPASYPSDQGDARPLSDDCSRTTSELREIVVF